MVRRINTPHHVNGCKRSVYETLVYMSDEELFVQFQQGVEAAFKILAARYGKKLECFLSRYVREKQTREDLVQETFERVYRNRHSWRNEGLRLSTWLYTIAGNLGKSTYRKKRRVKEVSIHQECEDGQYSIALLDGAPLPDRRVDNRFRIERLHTAVSLLPEKHYEVVVLRFFQQLTYKEIQKRTDVPLGTVKSRLSRGRKAVRAIYRELGSVHSDGAHAHTMDAVEAIVTPLADMEEKEERVQYVLVHPKAVRLALLLAVSTQAERGNKGNVFELFELVGIANTYLMGRSRASVREKNVADVLADEGRRGDPVFLQVNGGWSFDAVRLATSLVAEGKEFGAHLEAYSILLTFADVEEVDGR